MPARSAGKSAFCQTLMEAEAGVGRNLVALAPAGALSIR